MRWILIAGMICGLSAGAVAAPRHVFNSSSGLWPVGFSYFCLENPAECEPLATSTTTEAIKLEVWIDRLNAVNRSVNSQIAYREESIDHWDIAPASGDCDDYALTKRTKLIAAGVSKGVLPFAFTLTDHYGSHVVLLVKTTGGFMVLDNLSDEVYQLDQMMAQRLSVQDPMQPRNWTQIY